MLSNPMYQDKSVKIFFAGTFHVSLTRRYSDCGMGNNKENVMNKSVKKIEYALSVKDFMQTDVYKTTEKRAMRTSISFIATGILLPFIIGFFTALPDVSKPYFGISVFSNSVLAFIFTLPLSLGLIWSALPVYRRIIRRLFESYGFVHKVAA